MQAKSSIYLNSNDKDIIHNLKDIISNFISLESDQFNEMMEETGEGKLSAKDFLENLHMKQQQNQFNYTTNNMGKPLQHSQSHKQLTPRDHLKQNPPQMQQSSPFPSIFPKSIDKQFYSTTMLQGLTPFNVEQRKKQLTRKLDELCNLQKQKEHKLKTLKLQLNIEEHHNNEEQLTRTTIDMKILTQKQELNMPDKVF